MQFLQRLYDAVRQTMISPQADPEQTLIIGSALILLVAIFVLSGLTLYSHFTGKKQVVRKRKVRPLPRWEKWLFLGMVAAALLVLLVGSSIYIDQSSFCANCHLEQRTFETWKKSPHREVDCLDCHRAPSPSGYLAQKIDYLRWVWSFSFNTYKMPLRDSISNANCRRCHGSEISKVITRQGIKVQHKDFLDKGRRCTDCHSAVGHKVAVATYPSMNECLTCHDTKTAPAKCEVCHTPGTPGSKRIRREVVPIPVASSSQCRGCHKPSTWKRCIQCHGLEMPHPDGFRKGHSHLAFLNKELCLRCHSFPSSDKPPGTHGGYDRTDFCNRCHAFPSPHGTAERWAREHGPIALGQLTVVEAACSDADCHGSASSPVNYCTQCHSAEICDRCHKPGRYAPPEQ